MKVVENIRLIWSHFQFLRYSTGGSVMISGSFFCRPIIKILIFRFTISLFIFLYHRKFPRNFLKTFGKFQENYRKYFEILFTTPLPLTTPPNHPPHSTSSPIPYPPPGTSNSFFSITKMRPNQPIIFHYLHV